MVAAANPLAVDAGVRMLEQGGNAIDAMVATQLVLNLVEPSSSGLGGGAFLLYYDARAKAIRAIDGREVAPAAATPNLFVGADGKPMAFNAARVGGRSVGVPGTPRLLEIAHLRFGKLPWKKVFEPAIELAEKGFPVTPRFHKLIGEDKGLADEPAARAYFFDEQGQPKAVGTIIRNPEFAATLRKIAAGGADAYYTGGLARDIVAAVHAHRNAGTLEMQDLAGYRVREVESICGMYRAYKLCGMPPSSSGGIAVLQILGELSRYDMASIRPNSIAGGARDLGGRAPRLRRPQQVRGRRSLRRRARGGPSRSRVPSRALDADPAGEIHGQGPSGPSGRREGRLR